MKTTLVIAIALGALIAQQPYAAARYAAGAVPGLAPMAVGGGQVIVELTVDPGGHVEKVTTLRSTPPFTDLLMQTVRSWSFSPASEDRVGSDGKPLGIRNVASKVIVAATYRAPALAGPTHGERPVNLAAASPDVAFPAVIREPPFPVKALDSGVVLIEARVTAAGAVAEARVIGSAPPFDEPALAAARQWQFRPARVPDHADTYAYLIFGFPQPITIR